LGTFTSINLNEKNKLDLRKQHQYLTQNMCHWTYFIYPHLAAIIALTLFYDSDERKNVGWVEL
jgi:hypothetical protein